MSANHSQQLIDAPRFASLTPLIEPRSVAVIGASSDPTRIGGRPIAYMLRHGYAGQILPVNPNRAEIQGLPAFASVAELPQAPDVAIVAVPAPQVLETVRALGRQGARSAIVFSSGFSEVGEAGAAMQDAVVAAAREHGMRLLGPNALGAFNSNLGYYAFFSTSLERGVPLPGRVGIATQSGAYGAHLLGMARQRRLGTPICVATGNEADVTLGDSIGWLVESPEIDVVMAYAESIRNVDSFLAALEAAHRAGKPVILHKVGRSALGSRAALSHTASLAGDDKVLDAVLGDYAVIRARTTEELMDIAYLATRRIYPVGNSLGMITVSGGAGIIVSDAAEEVGLPMPPMPDMAQERLKARLSFASPINPVDCTAQALNDLTLVRDFTESMVVDGGYRSLLAFFTQAGTAASIGARLAEQFRRIKEAHPERLFVVSVMGEGGAGTLRGGRLRTVRRPHPGGSGDPGHGAARRSLRPAVAPAGLPAGYSCPPPRPAKPRPSAAGARRYRVRRRGGAGQCRRGGCLRRGHRIPGGAEARLGGHPAQVGNRRRAAWRKRCGRGTRRFPTAPAPGRREAPQARLDGVLVARQLQGGVECFMGIQRDPLFGPVALFGLGGIFVEVLQDVVFRRCPFEVDEAEAMIRSIRGAPLLLGARGRPRADVAALARLLSNLSRFAWEAGERLRSVDLNPVIALPEGQGAWAVDAVLEVEEVADGARS